MNLFFKSAFQRLLTQKTFFSLIFVKIVSKLLKLMIKMLKIDIKYQ
jgi:hypothetical protein